MRNRVVEGGAAGEAAAPEALFLHPPFDAGDLVARIFAPATPPAVRPATLEGWRVAGDGEGTRFALVEAAGGAVAGRLVAAGAEAALRIGFAMAALGAEPAPVTVAAEGGPIRAVGWRFGPAAPPRDPDPAPLDAEGRARLGEMLSEVMGLFGRREAAELPALLPGIAVRALARARGAASAVPAALSAAPGAEAVELDERVYPYARYFAVEEHRLRHPRFDGGMSEPVERSVFASGDAVTVLPFDPKAGTVLLIEQFRAGPWARRDPRPWCLETIAGRSDRAEPPEATARREAVEEAGLTLGRLERIGGYYPSPGIASEFIVGFVGEADLGGAGGTTHGLAEEQEDIRTLVVTLEAAMAAFASGEIRNAPLIVSLLWLDRHAARLRRAWA